jgi:hypothetical protein
VKKFNKPLALLCITLAVCGRSVINAQSAPPLFGLTFYDHGIAQGQRSQGVDVLNLPQSSYSDAFSLKNYGGALSIFQGSISGGTLRALSDTTFPYAGSSILADTDEYFFDTFTISGPAGQSGQFQVDLTFDGTVTGTNLEIEEKDEYGLLNTFNLLENGTVIPGIEYAGIVLGMDKGIGDPFHQTNSVVLNLSSGSTVVIGELLQMENLLYTAETGPEQLSIDDENSFIKVTALTAGFAFSTASGLNYSSQTDASVTNILPAVSMLTPGQLVLQFTGNTNAGYTVLGTTNLACPLTNWSNLGAPTILTNGTFQFIDTLTTTASQRFYLLRSP